MRVTCAVVVTFALLSPLAARAQEGGAQASAGYSYGRSDGQSLHGWTASLAFPFGGSLSLVAEATTHYGGFEGADLTRLSLLAGPRLSLGRGSPRPFVHVLAGLVRSSESLGVGGGVTISETFNDFGGAAGAGVDFALGGRWWLRLQGDYLAVRAGGETQGDPRASAAAVYRLGGK